MKKEGEREGREEGGRYFNASHKTRTIKLLTFMTSLPFCKVIRRSTGLWDRGGGVDVCVGGKRGEGEERRGEERRRMRRRRRRRREREGGDNFISHNTTPELC